MEHVYRDVKSTLKLAMPIIFAELSQITMGLIDTIMVGKLGAVELAACALGNAIYVTLLVIFTGVIFAVSPLVSQSLGAGNLKSISQSVTQGIWLSILLALLLALITNGIAVVLPHMGYDQQTALLAADYIVALSYGALPALVLACLRQYVEASGRAYVVMLITFVGLGCNVAANYVLMYGKFGFPALGVVGAGIATSFVYALMLVLVLAAIGVMPRLGLNWNLRRLSQPDLIKMREIFQLGWPIGLMLGLEFGLFGMSGIIVGYFGPTQLAAHQIAIQSVSVAYMVAVGIAIATSIRVGMLAGSGDPDSARISGRVGIVLAALAMSFASLLFALAPADIVSVYIDVTAPRNKEVVAFAISFLSIAAVFQIVDGIQVVSAGALRGIKDTKGPMNIAIVSYWGVGITVCLALAFWQDMEGHGVWWGLVVALVVASVQLVLRFERQIRNGGETIQDAEISEQYELNK